MRAGNRRGGALAAVLLGIVGTVALLIVTAIGVGVYVARNTTVKERGDSVRLETPIGSVRINRNGRADPRLMGIPIYPGATRIDDRRKLASVEFDFGDEHNEFVAMAAEYVTSDPPSRVTEYYHDKFPRWIFEQRRHGCWRIHMSESGYKRIIAIEERDGETRIALASIGEPAAN